MERCGSGLEIVVNVGCLHGVAKLPGSFNGALMGKAKKTAGHEQNGKISKVAPPPTPRKNPEATARVTPFQGLLHLPDRHAAD